MSSSLDLAERRARLRHRYHNDPKYADRIDRINRLTLKGLPGHPFVQDAARELLLFGEAFVVKSPAGPRLLDPDDVDVTPFPFPQANGPKAVYLYKGVPVDSTGIHHAARKTSPYDSRGIPLPDEELPDLDVTQGPIAQALWERRLARHRELIEDLLRWCSTI